MATVHGRDKMCSAFSSQLHIESTITPAVYCYTIYYSYRETYSKKILKEKHMAIYTIYILHNDFSLRHNDRVVNNCTFWGTSSFNCRSVTEGKTVIQYNLVCSNIIRGNGDNQREGVRSRNDATDANVVGATDGGFAQELAIQEDTKSVVSHATTVERRWADRCVRCGCNFLRKHQRVVSVL